MARYSIPEYPQHPRRGGEHNAASAGSVQCGVFDLALPQSLCNAWWEEVLAISFEVFAYSKGGRVNGLNVSVLRGAFFPMLWLARAVSYLTFAFVLGCFGV